MALPTVSVTTGEIVITSRWGRSLSSLGMPNGTSYSFSLLTEPCASVPKVSPYVEHNLCSSQPNNKMTRRCFIIPNYLFLNNGNLL